MEKQNAVVSREQLDLIERFTAAYNDIEQFFRRILGASEDDTFTGMVRDYSARYPRRADERILRQYATLRNAVTHGRIKPYAYLSVPLPNVVDDIEAMRDQLLNAPRLIPRFQKEVRAVKSTDTLSDVLALVESLEYSQFPVYDDGQYKGLLTENGITRWLAHHSTTEMTLVELQEISVKTLLRKEEKRPNCVFVSSKTTVEEALGKFAANAFLEAVIVTHSGQKEEKPIGIVTRWDAVRER
jgi:predicted transcriptional regulator